MGDILHPHVVRATCCMVSTWGHYMLHGVHMGTLHVAWCPHGDTTCCMVSTWGHYMLHGVHIWGHYMLHGVHMGTLHVAWCPHMGTLHVAWCPHGDTTCCMMSTWGHVTWYRHISTHVTCCPHACNMLHVAHRV